MTPEVFPDGSKANNEVSLESEIDRVFGKSRLLADFSDAERLSLLKILEARGIINYKIGVLLLGASRSINDWATFYALVEKAKNK